MFDKVIRSVSSTIAVDVKKAWAELSSSSKINHANSPTVQNKPGHLSCSICQDIISNICSYTEPGDLMSLRCCSKHLRCCVDRLRDEYWATHLPISSLSEKHNDCKRLYFERLFYSSQTEFRHFQSIQWYYAAIHMYNSKYTSGVVGLLSDIGWVNDDKLAKILSRKRFMTMHTVITNTMKDVHNFKAITLRLGQEGPHSFLPLEALQHMHPTEYNTIMNNAIETPGFINYAVNLIQLKPEHEYLRWTAYYGVFRDLMVFERRVDVINYTATLDAAAATALWVVTLEDYDASVLDDIYPRFSTSPRSCYYSAPMAQTKQRLENRIYDTHRALNQAVGDTM